MTAAGDDRPPEPGRRRFVAPVATLLAAVAVTAAVAIVLADQARDDARNRLKADAATATEAIDRRIVAYSEVLYAVRGLFESRETVTRRRFRAFVRSLEVQSRAPGILVAAFADRVERFDRERFAAEVRRDAQASGGGYPPFRIHPASARTTSMVVDYVEPVASNNEAFGFDLLSEPARAATVARTQSTGRPAASAPLALVQSGDRGFLFMLATRNIGSPLTDATTGRLRGVVSCAFDARRLLAGVLPRAAAGEFEVYDRGSSVQRASPLSRAGLLYDAGGSPAALEGTERDDAVLREVEVAGRRWAVFYERGASAGPAFAAAYAVAGAGLLASMLASGLVLALTSSRARALALAAGMTRDLEQANTELIRSNEDLQRFAFVAAHDLRAPLRIVGGFVELLERRFGEQLGDDGKRFVAHAVEGTERMSELIDRLLEYARAGTEQQTVAVALDSSWDAAVANLADSIAETGATVTRDDLPVVAGDPVQLERVMQNLISNALVYRSEAAPIVHASARRADGVWNIAVADNGIGVDPKDHELIFEPLGRLHGVSERPGTGLGLPIVKRIVEAGGGELRVTSVVGAGSTFTFTARPEPGS
jgi:signal transduction histidine kinase